MEDSWNKFMKQQRWGDLEPDWKEFVEQYWEEIVEPYNCPTLRKKSYRQFTALEAESPPISKPQLIILEEDISIVAQQVPCTEEEAKAALLKTNGDIVNAIMMSI